MSHDGYRGMASLQLRTIPYVRGGTEQYSNNDSHTSKLRNRLRKRPISVCGPQTTSLQFGNSTSAAREPRISDAYVNYRYRENQEFELESKHCDPADILQPHPIERERRRSMSFFWKPLTRKDKFLLEKQPPIPIRPAWYAPILPRSRQSLDSTQQRISIRTRDCPDSPASVQSRDSAYYSASDSSSKSPTRHRNAPFRWANITSPSSLVAPLFPIELPCLDFPILNPVDLSPIPKQSSSPCPSSIYPVELPATTCVGRASSSLRNTTRSYTEPYYSTSEVLASEYIGLIARDTDRLSYEDSDTSSSFSTNTIGKPPALRHRPHKLSAIEESAPTRRMLRHKASSNCLRRKSLIAEARSPTYSVESSFTRTTPTHAEPPSKAPTPPPRSILRCHESFRSQLVTNHSRPRTQDSKIQILIDAFESLQLELEGGGSDGVDMKQVRNLGDAYGRMQGLLMKDQISLDRACRS